MAAFNELDVSVVRRLAEMALEEDRAWNDVTTNVLVAPDQLGRGFFLVKAEGVIAGLPVVETVFRALDKSIVWQPLAPDGARVAQGEVIARIEGHLSPILRGERVALNLLQHLSGVATATARLVKQVEGLPIRILDTRKTLPGLRALQKYAVRVGGGTNHRMDLSDGVLIKDNHLAALRSRGLGIGDAVRLARENAPGMRIEIEVTNLTEVEEALAAGADELLLDNMTPDRMREAVALIDGRAQTEASGGITEANVKAIAAAGVDFASSGALTHSVKGLDISLELETA